MINAAPKAGSRKRGTLFNLKDYFFRKSRRILIVDDDKDLANGLKYSIEQTNSNLRCVVATDPFEALLILADQKFDFVFVDEKIPGLSGSNIIKKLDEYLDSDPVLNEYGNFSRPLPVAIMSGASSPPEKMHLRNFHFVRFINKKELSQALNELFGTDRSRTQPAQGTAYA